MTPISDFVIDAWKHREKVIILTTANPRGVPNTIYATCVSLYDKETFLIADNYFFKTRRNILSGCCGNLLFITDNGHSYQIKGRITYYRSGPYYDDMKKWNPEKNPGHGVAVLKIEEVFSGAEKLS